METQPVVVITGATNGLGRLAALDLARGGAQLGLVARSPQKADVLRREIEQAAPGTPVDVFRACGQSPQCGGCAGDLRQRICHAQAMQIAEARRGFRVHRCLLDKRSLTAHSGDTLSLRR